jgi:hypothetical protein
MNMEWSLICYFRRYLHFSRNCNHTRTQILLFVWDVRINVAEGYFPSADLMMGLRHTVSVPPSLSSRVPSLTMLILPINESV